MLDSEHAVQGLQAEAAFHIQKVGNVGLLKAGLARQLQAGELAGVNPPQQQLA
jgi:hypothetical protein